MHIDAREHDATTLESDVCVVGAGAAGISLAVALAGSGVRTLLVESGGFERSPETDALNEADTPTIAGDYLAASRVRVVGGTTSHWTGMCLPLSDATFESRPWVADSGWPIDGDALHPWYERACEQLEIVPWARDGQLARDDGLEALHLRHPPDRFETRVYQVKRRAHFGERHRDVLIDRDDVVLLTNATCTKLETEGQRVDRAIVRTLTGKRLEVRARAFVLAAGGIENARLLLVSGGLGNEHDLVGRYYMDHPELTVAEAVLWPSWDLELYLSARLSEAHIGFGALFATAAHQRESKLLQAGIQLRRSNHLWGSPQTREADAAVTAASFWLDCARGATPGEACLPAAQKTSLFARCEQAPDRDNRVTLGERRDAFDVPLPRLAWRINELDAASIDATVRALTTAIHREGLGRTRPFLGGGATRDSPAAFGFSLDAAGHERIHAEREPTIFLWGHHMGTTRMAAAPSRGVVDANGRVHGVANLYAAGSSVFPTGGAANPTLTIVALALRLGDHLRRELGPA